MSYSEKTFMKKCVNVNSSPFNCNMQTSAALGGPPHLELGFDIPIPVFGNVPSGSCNLLTLLNSSET